MTMMGQPGVHTVRTSARRKALQLLFQSEVTGQSADQIIREELYVADQIGLPCDYTRLLLDGVCAHRDELDSLISSTSENWSLTRMPLVDRSILCLATYEMLYCQDVPMSVTINEAVELAKNFGGEDDSPRFVNGVLGKIAGHLAGFGSCGGSSDTQNDNKPGAEAPVELATAD